MKSALSADPLVIVGLGNPGSEYAGTRHNFGFIVVDYLLQQISSSSSFAFVEYAQAEIAPVNLAGKSVFLVKPQTFMNNSGIAVRALRERVQFDDLRLLVIHDDLDLDLGRIKLQQGGGSGGHNGLKSLFDELDSSNFLRFRLGVGGEMRVDTIDTVKFVLDRFPAAELKLVDDVKQRVFVGLIKLLESGVPAAMNQLNRRIRVEDV